MYEIDPGQAALTEHLVEYSNNLKLVEIDNDLVPIPQQKFAQHNNVTILHQDALELEITNNNTRIIGNLPYNISTPLLIGFLYKADKIPSCVCPASIIFIGKTISRCISIRP